MVCLGDNSTHAQLDVFRAAVDTTMVTCIILGNFFILFAVVRHWREHGIPIGNKTSTILVINLSLSDGLIGVCSVYFLLPEYVCSIAERLQHDFLLCMSRFVLMTIAYQASAYTLIAIAIDRYIAVMYAVRYPDILNTRRTLAGVAAIWLSAVVVGTMFFYWNDWSAGRECLVVSVITLGHYLGFGLTGYLAFVVTAAIVYYRIHQVATNLRAKSQELTLVQKINSKSGRALLLILGVYTFACVPYIVAITLKRLGVEVPILLIEITATLLDVNPLVNPFIYAHTNRTVKKAISSVLKIFKRRLSNASLTLSSPSDVEKR